MVEKKKNHRKVDYHFTYLILNMMFQIDRQISPLELTMGASDRFNGDLPGMTEEMQRDNENESAYLIMSIFEQFVEINTTFDDYGNKHYKYYMPPNLKWKWFHVRKDTSEIEEVS